MQFDMENLTYEDKRDAVRIEIQDTWGNVASLNASKYKILSPMTKAFIYKTDYLTDDFVDRFVPQTVLIPLEDFKNKNKDLNLDEINKIEFKFMDNIEISIDNLGISN